MNHCLALSVQKRTQLFILVQRKFYFDDDRQKVFLPLIIHKLKYQVPCDKYKKREKGRNKHKQQREITLNSDNVLGYSTNKTPTPTTNLLTTNQHLDYDPDSRQVLVINIRVYHTM